MHSPRPVSAENTLRGRTAAALYHNPTRRCQKRQSEQIARVNAPESAQIGRPNLKATRRNVVALSKVRQNWYVYFRDGAFTFARYVHAYPDFFGMSYPEIVPSPCKHWLKNIFRGVKNWQGLSSMADSQAKKRRPGPVFGPVFAMQAGCGYAPPGVSQRENAS